MNTIISARSYAYEYAYRKGYAYYGYYRALREDIVER